MAQFLDTFTGAAGNLSGHTPEIGTYTSAGDDLAIDGAGYLRSQVAAYVNEDATTDVAMSNTQTEFEFAVKVIASADGADIQGTFYLYDYRGISWAVYKNPGDPLTLFLDWSGANGQYEMEVSVGTTYTVRTVYTPGGTQETFINGVSVMTSTIPAWSTTTFTNFGFFVQRHNGGGSSVELARIDYISQNYDYTPPPPAEFWTSFVGSHEVA